MKTIVAPLFGCLLASGTAAEVPSALIQTLPPGYWVLADARLTTNNRAFIIVALGRKEEPNSESPARARPLMIFEMRGGRFHLVGRNDSVISTAGEGRCDPFPKGDAQIAVTGAYFTVENMSQCGQRWTDFVTFRFDRRFNGFVFDNDRQEDLVDNPGEDPDEDRIISYGPQRVTRPPRGHVIAFKDWP